MVFQFSGWTVLLQAKNHFKNHLLPSHESCKQTDVLYRENACYLTAGYGIWTQSYPSRRWKWYIGKNRSLEQIFILKNLYIIWVERKINDAWKTTEASKLKCFSHTTTLHLYFIDMPPLFCFWKWGFVFALMGLSQWWDSLWLFITCYS